MTTTEAYGKATRRLWRDFRKGVLTPEEYKAQSIALLEQWKEEQRISHEHEMPVTTTKRPGAWVIEVDNDTQVLLMSALSRAIASAVADGRGEGEEAEKFRALGRALNRTDYTEGF